MISPIPSSSSTSIRKGRSRGPRASCSSTVRSRFGFRAMGLLLSVRPVRRSRRSHGIPGHDSPEGQYAQQQGQAGKDTEQLVFAPAPHLQMVVQGRHAEKALSAGLFEIDYLDDVGQHLHHIDQAHHRDDHWQIQGKGHPAHRAAQEQGARVSHEHLGGVEVIDQEGGQPSGHGGGGGDQVAAAVPGRHRHIEEHHRNGDAGSKAVHPVGEVHRIDGAHHDKGGEHHIHDPGDPHDLDVQKGNVQVGGEVAVPPQQYGEGDGRRQLKQELLGWIYQCYRCCRLSGKSRSSVP